MIDLDAQHLIRLRALAGRSRQAGSVTYLPGGVVTRPRGRGLETADLRPFAPGDDPRHLDRNATARTGQPQIRLFHAERDRTLILIADFRPSMLWGTRRTLRSVAAAEALAQAGWTAVAQGARVGLIAITANDTMLLAPRTRDRAMLRAIGGMVRAHAAALAAPDAAEPSLADALALAARATPRGAEVLLASALDHPGAAFHAQIRALANRAAVTVLRVTDAFETGAPPGRYRFATRARPDGRVGRARPAPPDLDDLPVRIRIHETAPPPEARLYG